jgi:hypothetical protein
LFVTGREEEGNVFETRGMTWTDSPGRWPALALPWKKATPAENISTAKPLTTGRLI